MLHIPDNIRQDIIRLVPMYIVNDISCFVYHDNHPQDSKTIDITICTKNGEVKEFYQRELVSEVYLDCPAQPSEIKIMRNSECELFYIVIVGDNLIVLSRRDKLYIHRKVDNVERYDIDDSLCHGQACLKIVRKDDAVPLIFDDKFESLGDKAMLLSSLHVEETSPVLTELNRKLIEAKYSVKCNENTYKEYQNLRQLAAFSIHRKLHPNVDEAVFKSGSKEMALKIKTQSPWVKLCNKKIVIILNIINEYEKPLEHVHILLHVKNRPSIVYTTKLFQRQSIAPYWKEKKNHTIEQTELAVTAIVDLTEIKENICSRVDFSGVMVYRREGKEYLLPFDHVSLSAKDVMDEAFDVLSTELIDEHHTILAILATTDKTNLVLRHIMSHEDPELDIPAVFSSHLHMQQLQNASNVIIHRSSPYHPLNGIMCVFSEAESPLRNCIKMSIHTRSPSQVLSFIHYVHDAVPYKFIITTTNHRIVAKTNEYSQYTEDLSDGSSEVNYTDYALAMLKQTTILKEHLDVCMVSMNDSKIPEIQRKIGTEIDLFAAGTPAYVELRNKMLEEESKGITKLNSSRFEE